MLHIAALVVNWYPDGIVISCNLKQLVNVLANETAAVGADGNVILSKAGHELNMVP